MVGSGLLASVLGLLCMGIATGVNVGLFETADAAGISFHMKGQADVFETFQRLTTGFREIIVTNVLPRTSWIWSTSPAHHTTTPNPSPATPARSPGPSTCVDGGRIEPPERERVMPPE